MNCKSLLFVFSWLGLALNGWSASAATFGPSPYLSSADSPFAGLPFSYFYLENFEDGLLNTLGVSVNAGATVGFPNTATDSVDGDDGAIDGSGQHGHSLYSGNGLTNFTFLFDSATLGGLPTHAGIVWTDVGLVTSGSAYAGPVTAEAYDAADQLLASLGPVTLGGDGSVDGNTAEDRFFGFSSDGGISRLVISMSNSNDWEVDHLQYGRLVPEPSSASLGLLAAMGLAGRSRARRRVV